MKQIVDLTIIDTVKIGDAYSIIRCTSKDILPEMKPGQFASLKIENNPKVFLRRPFSIHDYDKTENTVAFLIKIVGEGSRTLTELKRGDTVNAVLPLGNSFHFDAKGKSLIVGGGCGIAPIYFLAKCMKEINADFDIIIGGRTCNDLLCLDNLSTLSTTFCATEDGSKGSKGFVTDIPALSNNLSQYGKIHCCGPEGMMKAIAKTAVANNVFCEASLENTMACGIGVCLCCVTKTVHGNECVCSKGPIFNVKELAW
ncbi:MAG: dihydroorotate dehydrogenase electron transfer subunit [Bacteroidales bacterium]|nr:dihydroorotate dehydrogenase electron transfer subunit [Bacteroidales bacterium]